MYGIPERKAWEWTEQKANEDISKIRAATDNCETALATNAASMCTITCAYI